MGKALSIYRPFTVAVAVAGAGLLYGMGSVLDGLVSRPQYAALAPLAGALVFFALAIRSSPRETPPATTGDSAQYGYYDFLTNLPNRVLLADRFHTMVANARRQQAIVALHMIDLDGFKDVNDRMGHLAGDDLLAKVAKRICGICREVDTVARLGGDEFVILQLIEEHNQAAALAQRVLEGLSKPFVLDRGEVAISCSVGIGMTSGIGASLDRMIDMADHALYASKRGGGNAITFYTHGWPTSPTIVPLHTPKRDMVRRAIAIGQD